MADVGVLNLQINDNSQQAAQGLDNLGEALRRVRDAVKDAMKISSVANGLEKLGKIVNENISGSTIVKIGQLADELSKLQGLGDLNIKISGGSSVESIRKAVQETMESMKEAGTINTGFDEYAERVGTARDALNGMNGTMNESRQIIEDSDRAWTHGAERFAELFEEMSRLRMMFSLPAGAETGISTEVEQGWTEWKDGAIEVEGTVSDAMSNVAGYLYEGQEAIHKAAEARDEFVAPEGWGTGSIEGLVASATELGERLRGAKGTIEQYRAIEEVMNATGLSKNEIMRQLMEIEKQGRSARDVIADIVDRLNGASTSGINWSKSVDRMLGIGAESKSAKDSASVFEEAFGNTDALTETEEKFRQLNPLMEEYSENAVKASTANFSLGDAFKTMKKGVAAMFPTLTGMIKRLGQIAKYRMLRSVLKHITAGFSEGVQNVYQYSKAIGGSFADSMDAAASALLQMKNSVGASVAPAIQALIPLLQTVVNWFIQAVNYVNQFLALLNGQKTWTRALPATASAFDKQTKAAKGAAAAVKDLLADWDELNIIQNETGGGGSGSGAKAAEDYLKMFEEVSRFDNKIKDVSEFLKDHMNETLGVVKDIGLAILGWKFSSAFTGLLGKLGRLVTIGLVVKLASDVTALIDEAYMESSNGAYLLADAVANGALAAVAGKLASAVFGKSAGMITAGLTIAISTGATFDAAEKASEAGKDAEAEALRIAGFVKDGIATALVSAGLIMAGVGLPLAIVGGVATVGVATVISFSMRYAARKVQEETEAAKEAFRQRTKGGIDPEKYLKQLQLELDKRTAGAKLVIDAHVDFPNLENNLANAMVNIRALSYYVSGEGKLTKEDAEAFKKSWSDVFQTLDDMNKVSFNTILSGLNESLAGAVGEARDRIAELRTEFISLEHNVDKKTAEMYKELEDIVDRIYEGNYSSDEDKQKDIERYALLTEAISMITDTTYDDIRKQIDAGKGIDFSETGLEGAIEWINSVEEASKEANDTLDTALSDFTESIDLKRKELDALVYKGDMTQEEADAANAMFDELVRTYTDTINKKKTDLRGLINQAYSDALKGAFGEGMTDRDWRRVVLPMLQTIQKAGGEIPVWAMEYLQNGMEGNLLEGTNSLSDSFFTVLFKNSGDFGIKHTAEEAVKIINDRVQQVIDEGHGQDYFLDTIKLFGLSGVDVLSDNWKKDIIRQAKDAGLSDDFVEQLASGLGIDGERFKTIIDELVAEEMDLSSYKYRVFDTEPLEITISEIDASIPDQELERTKEELRKDIQSAMQDGLNLQEYDWLIGNYGDLFYEIFDELGYAQPWDWGEHGSSNMPTGHATGASTRYTGMPLTNYANAGAGMSAIEPKSNEQEISNTAAGVQRGNGDLLTAINTLIGLTRQLNYKQWTLNFNPTSTAGNWVARAAEAFGKTTGG